MRRIPHRSRNGVACRFPCHVTLKMRADVPNLRNAKLVRALEASFAALGNGGPARLAHYSIQGDHVHLIVEARDRDGLGRGMKSISARIARAVNRTFAHRGPVVADRYHLHVLRTPREVWNALRYVLLNSRKHARRSEPGHRLDAASSSRWFTGWKNLDIRATSPATTESSPVTAPRTWLLAVGWRKHGLLDPREIPGRRARTLIEESSAPR